MGDVKIVFSSEFKDKITRYIEYKDIVKKIGSIIEETVGDGLWMKLNEKHRTPEGETYTLTADNTSNKN